MTYWDEVEQAVGTGTRSILLGTSARSLRKNLARLRAVTEEAVMENPATWGEAEKVAAAELDRYYQDVHHGGLQAGLSLPRRIADALRAAGLLLPDPVSLDDDQLDAYVSHLDELMTRAVREPRAGDGGS